MGLCVYFDEPAEPRTDRADDRWDREAFSASYGMFAIWRNSIARALGWETIPLERDVAVLRYVIPEHKTLKLMDSDDVSHGDWETDPDDVIDVLMLHSDCDGAIPVRFLMPLALRLEALSNHMPDDLVPWTERFIRGCVAAYEADQPLLFR